MTKAYSPAFEAPLRSLAADFGERTGIIVTVDAPERLPRLAAEAELAVFRTLQEALSNVARHSGAERAAVRIWIADGGVALRVSDDGRGFGGVLDLDRLESAGHLGLTGMRERIGVVGGRVALGEEDGGGARVDIWVPAEEQ